MKVLTVVVLLAVVGVGLGAAYRSQSTCVVGVKGTRATVTAHGFGAMNRCKRFASRNRDYYIRTESVTEPVLCELDRDGLHLTVRDEGLVVLVGRMLCADLKDANSQTSF